MIVIAEFPDGDKLKLRVKNEFNNVPVMSGDKILCYDDFYTFEESNVCKWWYKDLCTIVE